MFIVIVGLQAKSAILGKTGVESGRGAR